MITRNRVRVLLGVAFTLAIVVPLGWMWWGSLLPASYSAMDMGYADYGGGARASGMGGMHHGGSTSVADLDTPAGGAPDVRVALTTRAQAVRLPTGSTLDGYTVNGTSPGPTIRATRGDLVEVRLHNEDVEGGVALHWHGVDVPNAEDGVAGVTQDAVMPGKDHVYRWVAPDAGTYWYHSHQLSHEQVSRGLFGALVIQPAAEPPQRREALGVVHTYAGTTTLNGDAGEERVVAAPGEHVRVRLVNTDNGATRAWASDRFRLLAVDGTEVNGPGEVTDRAVRIPAGGRADLEVVVPDAGAVRVQLLGGVGLVVGPDGATARAVPDPPEDNVDLLEYGTSRDLGFDPSAADRRFDYSIGRRPGFLDGKPGLWWSVNGHLYPDMPMMTVREGDVVRVRISNHSGEVHPMHLHGHHAVVLSRDGRRATGSPWWFDSLDVENGETFEVAFVADNPGIWMDHCHNLKHAREGLITHLMYDGVTTPYLLGEESGNLPE